MNMPRTKLIPNGKNIVHTFSDTEYKNRQSKLRNYMTKNNIDTAIFTIYSQHQLLQ
jgi:creatinase